MTQLCCGLHGRRPGAIAGRGSHVGRISLRHPPHTMVDDAALIDSTKLAIVALASCLSRHTPTMDGQVPWRTGRPGTARPSVDIVAPWLWLLLRSTSYILVVVRVHAPATYADHGRSMTSCHRGIRTSMYIRWSSAVEDTMSGNGPVILTIVASASSALASCVALPTTSL